MSTYALTKGISYWNGIFLGLWGVKEGGRVSCARVR